MSPFSNRMSAGRLLASKLQDYAGQADVVVAGLPNGGIPVAFEIARRLQRSLDVIFVRKVSLPWQPELALGAVASGAVRVIDRDILRSVSLSDHYFYNLIAKEEAGIERREALFRSGYPAERLPGRTVILVDDGAATGSTMLAAIETVRKQYPKHVIVALPVASRDALTKIESKADKCFCLAAPASFIAVGQWYDQFPQVADEEVQSLLARSRGEITRVELVHTQTPSQ